MRSSRRVALTGALVALLALGGSPFHTVEFVDAAPEVIEAEVGVAGTELVGDGATRRTGVIEAPIAFTGLWAELDRAAEAIHARTSEDGETWSDWTEIDTLDADDGPDDGSEEDLAGSDQARTSELLIADESNYLQLEVPGDVGAVRVHLADASGANDSLWVRATRFLTRSAVPAEASDTPAGVVSRREWGADERRTGSTRAASGGVRMAVVHHTASKSDYTRDEVPNQLRIIQSYHIGLGWSDVGYNALVDRFGRIYEGRQGGLDRAVIGAHARGFNTGSFGVAVMGNFTDRQAPQAAIDAVSDIIGYKAAIHGFDPAGTTTFNGRTRPTVVGHQDVGQTLCPARIQQMLPQIRDTARMQAVSHGSPFRDIDATNTHGSEVLRLHNDGVINGCEPGRYCPRADLTRAQAASLIARALELPDADGSRFTDVQQGATHEKQIGAVAAAGIVTGYDDGSFRPTESLTRDQMASFLARAMDLAPVRGSAFSDVSAGSTHGGNVYAVREANITNGCTPSTYCPRDHVTRAQMASFVDRMRLALGFYDEPEPDEGPPDDEPPEAPPEDLPPVEPPQ